MLQGMVHYGIHLIAPLVVSILFYKKKWMKSYAILLSTFVIDFDHLLATPLFDPNRCSIDFHPLHSYIAIAMYVCLLIPSRTRLIGIGLCIHIIADGCDCLFM
ncbi:DUF6122 family protein [Flavobacteriaceae bacterium]|nr:DUF6122 family protein [Flavobacteriaceae bacterium]MDB4290151.1 DUF6122 family protein [Flavobacteriaceae bacterium]MDB9874371.1 DUF6122 family protein [Flavobacteriaceae bacterium]MDC1265560.1 DUF6122 family protein [Flavobacteriaceae bacterium]